MTNLRFDKTTGHFKHFARIESEVFKFLLGKIGPKIMKQDTNAANVSSSSGSPR